MNDYQLVKEIVSELKKVGDVKTIDKPTEIERFRKYLTVEGQRVKKQFATKAVGDKLHIARIKKESVWDKLS